MLDELARKTVDRARQRSSDLFKARYHERRTRAFHVLRGQRPDEFRIACRPPTPGGSGATTVVALREHTTDWSTFKEIYIRQSYRIDYMAHAVALRAAYAQILAQQRTPLILDIGANIGLASVYFHQEYPEADIVAVEPAPTNVEMLRRNCASHPQITIREAGIAARPGRLSLTNPSGDADAFRTCRATAGDDATVQAVTVAELLDASLAGAGRVPFIAKIDIEGFEQELFGSDTGWIEEFPMLIVELHDWMLPGRATSRNFLRCVSELDRDFLYAGENVFSFSNRLLAHDPRHDVAVRPVVAEPTLTNTRHRHRGAASRSAHGAS